MEHGARLPRVHHELAHSDFASASKARDRTDGTSLTKKVENVGAGFMVEPVHTC